MVLKVYGKFISSDLSAFSADVFIASDGPRVRQDWPTMSLGARGAINFDLTCNLREGGHHSGIGAVHFQNQELYYLKRYRV